jgi:cytochrome c peroxidase
MQWNKLRNILLICFVSIFIAVALNKLLFTNYVAVAKDSYTWNIPSWVPKPIVPVNNSMSNAKVQLGRHLFYEKRLSITGEFSCASCHIQAVAFTDAKVVAVGATGEKHPRNSMSLTNAGYNSVQTWANPFMTSLENQLLVPLFGEHPKEMGMAGKEKEILAMLKKDPKYKQMFANAFAKKQDTFTINNLAKAIASFERTLVSFNSPYDRYRYGGDSQAISEQAKRGEILFHSDRLECFHCHGGINFSDSVIHQRLAFPEIAFHNTGLYNIDSKGGYPPNNTGVHELTNKSSDMGRFKAPTLRNIALTAPYMHDGSINTLGEVIDHYAVGGRTIEKGLNAGIGNKNPFKSQFISGFQITDQERQDLIAFLESLTDESFINNPNFSNPSTK